MFYGWWIVAAVFMLLFCFGGLGIYPFPSFIGILAQEFGWSRGVMFGAFTGFSVVMGISSPFIGRIVDRMGAKKVMLFGGVVATIAFLILWAMQSLWMLYAAYLLMGLGMGCFAQVPSSYVVSQWFTKKRGTAIGIMSLGVGIGGLVGSPLTGGYLIPNLGWRTTFLVFAIACAAIVIPIALFVIKTKPSEMGLYPDGAAAPPAAPGGGAPGKAAAPAGMTLAQAQKTSAFWMIAISFVLSGLAFSGILQNQIPMVQDLGISLGVASGALGVVAFASSFARFGFGWLCDIMSVKLATIIGLVLELTGILILFLVKPESPIALLYVYAIIMGLGVGSWMPVMSILTSRNFGMASYGGIFGMLTMYQMVIGTAIGPTMAGLVFDATGTYYTVFIYSAIAIVISIIAIILIKQPKIEGA